MLSICEAVIANNGEVVQPPNSQVQVKQPAPQQSTSVPNQSDPAVSVNNQAPIGQDSNSAAGQKKSLHHFSLYMLKTWCSATLQQLLSFLLSIFAS